MMSCSSVFSADFTFEELGDWLKENNINGETCDRLLGRAFTMTSKCKQFCTIIVT